MLNFIFFLLLLILENKIFSQRVWFAGILVSLIIFISFMILKHKKKIRYQRFEKVVDGLRNNALESEKKLNINLQHEEFENIALKSTTIADETIASLLNKLEKFEKSNKFTRQDVNFAYLTKYVGTNSKYLNEILKQYKGKSFSQYINGLRIEYIMKLLYEEPKYRAYKISYLAELCGFSSREVFTIAFKKKTDISPSYFIESLQQEEIS
ncbi:hypothetical protein A0O34_16800 [Chryseobacterium glaciei]|uniref:HTH araC/xylS-type domain-containing protein n=1 Tax=Chryseobacterium glaciei TaxID=1685010 RepID=A0A172XYY4_9FLAO|nr:helix-turn-helix transcriptional regulator [Chryseobacterium glaciei]ANF52072.1 hypothetical protein A0O34_16800 [Chryseobacterium glaciei]